MSSNNGSANGKLVIISGPSGSGKTTICKELTKDPKVRASVSATTRPPRSQEVDGKDYYFVSEREFERKIKEGYFDVRISDNRIVIVCLKYFAKAELPENI